MFFTKRKISKQVSNEIVEGHRVTCYPSIVILLHECSSVYLEVV